VIPDRQPLEAHDLAWQFKTAVPRHASVRDET